MSDALVLTPEPPDTWREGWRTARRSCDDTLAGLEMEARGLARDALAGARQRIAALPVPPAAIAMPRAARLEAAMRAALALVKAGQPDTARAVLEDALA